MKLVATIARSLQADLQAELRDIERAAANLRRSEDLLSDVADAFARIEDPAERVRLAFKLFDSEGVALVNLLRDGSGALEEMRASGLATSASSSTKRWCVMPSVPAPSWTRSLR